MEPRAHSGGGACSESHTDTVSVHSAPFHPNGHWQLSTGKVTGCRILTLLPDSGRMSLYILAPEILNSLAFHPKVRFTSIFQITAKKQHKKVSLIRLSLMFLSSVCLQVYSIIIIIIMMIIVVSTSSLNAITLICSGIKCQLKAQCCIISTI